VREASPRTIARQREDIGFVFQRFNLFPHMTAIENVSLGPVRVRGEARAEARAQAAQLLTRVGLADSSTPTRQSSPEASSSGSRSPEHWR
jgi:polar amino acid transport system ATP-binding protein